MRWYWKWAVQRACASVPLFSQSLYYFLQQRFGPVAQSYDAGSMLGEAVRMTRTLHEFGKSVAGASILEVGSGWRVDIPLGFYLCGAGEVLTFDRHRYLREPLVLESIEYVRAHEQRIRELFAQVTTPAKLDQRLAALRVCRTLNDVLTVARIRYHAPADAAATGLPAHSIDIHFSYTVFEHIPAEALVAILREAGRLLRPGGVALHHIDLSDHFAHVDPDITAINFLRYSDRQWNLFASTPWSYHNRLRADDYRSIYDQAAHRIVDWRPHIDPQALAAIANHLPLADRYRRQSPEHLSTIYLDVLSEALRLEP